MPTFRGSCLCGEVAFEVEGPFDHFLKCHCSRCRKATGAAHSSEVIVKASALRWIRDMRALRPITGMSLSLAKWRDLCPVEIEVGGVAELDSKGSSGISIKEIASQIGDLD